MTQSTETVSQLTRPIIGIENRTPLEVFDIMCDRIDHAARTSPNKDETIAKAVNSVVDAVIGSNADLLRDSGATYRRCCMAARDAARAALTSTKKEG